MATLSDEIAKHYVFCNTPTPLNKPTDAMRISGADVGQAEN